MGLYLFGRMQCPSTDWVAHGFSRGGHPKLPPLKRWGTRCYMRLKSYMGFFVTRVRAISLYLAELLRFGAPEMSGPVGDELWVVLDGVGGFQFAPLAVRRALRELGRDVCTIAYRWQYGLPGEIFTDLMWLRRNRVMGCKLARKLCALRRAHPNTTIHLVAFSGGAGIAVFACEHLAGRGIVDTLLLACPALSPTYNLGRAFRAVNRAYSLVSDRDTAILGVGTRIFGTTDRRFVAAAGQVGFTIPPDASADDRRTYEKLGQIRWTPSLKAIGHHGGHTTWASVAFIREHLPPILRGEPLLDARSVADAEQPPPAAHTAG